jgi:FkbH-like protein
MTPTDLQRLIADPARQTEARARLRDALEAAPRTVAYQQWLAHLPPASDSQAVVLLSSFTLETLEPFLQVQAYLSGWRARTRYVQYGLWQNALLQPSIAGIESSAAVVLLLHDTELLGEGGSGGSACGASGDSAAGGINGGSAAGGINGDSAAAAGLARLVALLDRFRQLSAKPLFLGIVQAPPDRHPLALGQSAAAAAAGAGPGRLAARADLAHGLATLPSRVPDLHLLALNADTLGTTDWFDATGYRATRSVFAHRALPGLAQTVARHVACLFKPRRKVLVLDLDNTLWGGVVGEDGVAGVALGQDHPGAAFLDFQRLVLALRSTGVLLAMASKNNEADALAVFAGRSEMLLQPEHFSARRINWADKASNIASIAQQLGLGLDSLVFADDSAIECALVRHALPQVEVVELGTEPALFGHKLLRTQAFDVLHLTQEDHQRAASYTAEANRQELREQVTDMASFLADCQLRLALKPVTTANLERVHQLLGKTNQFNVSLQRPSLEALQVLVQQGNSLYSAVLTDRFGDYGLVGVLLLRQAGGVFHIDNIALSCRALGRGVEAALLAFAHQRGTQAACTQLQVCAVRGPRNQQVLDCLDGAGFVRQQVTPQQVQFVLNLEAQPLAWPAYLAVDMGVDTKANA